MEYLSLWPQDPPSKPQVVLAVANALRAYPDLSDPQHRFLVAAQADRLWFGEILVEPTRDYRRHDAKPYRTSSSLPARLARALVNLVAPPARSILDPFCGTGSILLEAGALGLRAIGVDNNIKMAGMSRRNLAHFGYHAQVELGDAQDCAQTADAIVTDLPYGRLLEQDQEALREVLHHTVQLAPQAVILAEEDITPWLHRCGLRPRRMLPGAQAPHHEPLRASCLAGVMKTTNHKVHQVHKGFIKPLCTWCPLW